MRQSHRDCLNILTFPTHERYETFVCKTGFNFYSLQKTGAKHWNKTYAPIPPNYTVIRDELPIDLDIDLVFILSRNNYREAVKLCKFFHVPLVFLEVRIPAQGMAQHLVHEAKDLVKGHVNVFIDEKLRNIWGWGEDESAIVIEHGIDSERFAPQEGIEREALILTAINDFANRDWSHGFAVWKKVTSDLPVKLYGDNPGISEACTEDELILAYQSSEIYFNPTKEVTTVTSMLEAMACGCAVVSTATGEAPNIIENGVNGFVSNDVEELRSRLMILLKDKDLCRQIGQKGRETVLNRFNLPRFVDDWKSVFLDASTIVWKGHFNEG